ncbi:MAG TPA: hypothetical protein DCR43_04650 [Bacteroidales bacterium]|nr:hypothetical protein [Bacteroidales bacterium]HBZ66008.1 hypothetical protein [Bacteroidales bacterium]
MIGYLCVKLGKNIYLCLVRHINNYFMNVSEQQFLMENSFFSRMKNPLWLLIIVVFLTGSCVPQKKIKYLQSAVESDSSKNFVYTPSPDYKMRVGDNLYIKVQSFDEKTYRFFNPDGGNVNSNAMYNDAGIYLNSYLVDNDGNISFPYIGKVQVLNQTVDGVKATMQKIIDQYLKETTLIVKMVSFKITILGEIKMPGSYPIYQDKLNIFEAIAKAGDLSDFANRSRVILLRKSENGVQMHRLDLTQEKILESPYFFLQPNDILYIEPLRGKQFAFSQFPYTILFSVISSTLLIMNYLK